MNLSHDIEDDCNPSDKMDIVIFAEEDERIEGPMLYEVRPFNGKVSPTACLGGRTPRPTCSCCGGSEGIRRAWRRLDVRETDFKAHKLVTKGKKPKHKDHR